MRQSAGTSHINIFPQDRALKPALQPGLKLSSTEGLQIRFRPDILAFEQKKIGRRRYSRKEKAIPVKADYKL